MSASATSSNPVRLQRLIVVVGIGLMLAKFTAWLITDSNAILTDATESIVNVLAGSFTWYSLYLSARPKDDNHPYGHGKIEFLAAGIEGALLGVAGLLIAGKSTYNLWFPEAVHQLDTGIWITAGAGLVNFALGWVSIRKGRRENSLPAVASGKHLQSDAWSTLGLVIGLLLLQYTGWLWIDSAVAILFGAFLVYTSYTILKPSVAGIMDEADDALLKQLVAVLQQNRLPAWIDIHNVRLIKYGTTLHLDGHLTLPRYYDLDQAHAELDRIDALVQQAFGTRMEFFIHVDPCLPTSCTLCCVQNCPVRASDFKRQLKWDLGLIMQNKKHFLG
jgi:cation diffusion facilitator family transporter